jgi:hypothetical protein
VAARVRASWTTWRGNAIEPVIREALRRLSDQLPDSPQAIGSYWTRTLTGTRSRQLNASPGSEPQRDAGNQPDCP